MTGERFGGATLGELAAAGCGAAIDAINESNASPSSYSPTPTQPNPQPGPQPQMTAADVQCGSPACSQWQNQNATTSQQPSPDAPSSQPSTAPGAPLAPLSSSGPSFQSANVIALANVIDSSASQLASYDTSVANSSLTSTSDFATSLTDFFDSGPTSDGLEGGAEDQTYMAQSGGGPLSSLDALSNAASTLADSSSQSATSITDADLASIGASNTNAAPSSLASSITDADLASIGADGTGTAPTSLSADAQQLPGQLSAFDQQQQAAAAAAAAAAAQAAQQQALQQQQLLAQQQAQQARLQAAQAAAAQSQNSSGGSLSGWGSLLLQGLSMFTGRGIVRPAPAPNGPVQIGGFTCVNTTGQTPVGPLPPQCK